MKGCTTLTAMVGLRGCPGGRKPRSWQVPGWKIVCSIGKQKGEQGTWSFSVFNQLQIIFSLILAAFL